jgi:uncharacterized membrane protein YkvA (DUF1232 family)
MSEFDPTSDDFAEMSESAGPVSRERAQRFYDRMRNNIQRYLSTRGAERSAAPRLLGPDSVRLRWRLVTDPRVGSKNKMLLGSGIAYYIFPFDIMPEGFIGVGGFVDDLLLAVYVLNKMLADTDVEILRDHWSGNEDILAAIQRILNTADNLVGSDLLTRLKRLVK